MEQCSKKKWSWTETYQNNLELNRNLVKIFFLNLNRISIFQNWSWTETVIFFKMFFWSWTESWSFKTNLDRNLNRLNFSNLEVERDLSRLVLILNAIANTSDSLHCILIAILTSILIVNSILYGLLILTLEHFFNYISVLLPLKC